MNAWPRMRAAGLDRTTAALLVVALGLSVLHIADHVLRVDHSGWPFRARVTPFTYSLLAFPMLFFALYGPRRLYWWRWAFLAIGTMATLYAHVFVETPHMQYAMWADDRSADPHQQGYHNIPEVRSGLIGAASAIVAMR